MAKSKKPLDPSKAARSLASLGGNARRDALAPEERKAIARHAAQERWARTAGMPKETHTGTLKVGNLQCSVLDNGARVFSVNGLLRAFGTGAKSRAALDDGTPVPEFLAAINVRPYISIELRAKLSKPVEFRSMRGGNGFGYAADILTLICDALLDARAAGVLRPNQLKTANGAESLMRAFSKVGVIALIDEATGYQADRASDELQRLVAAYVVEDMRPWVRLFPDSFFKQVYRIHGWQYRPGVTQGPRYVGTFINRYVYERLPPQVVTRLRTLNPIVGTRRRHKHFQFLSEEIGEPTVDRHLASVTTLMSVARDKTNFVELFNMAFPKPGTQMVLPAIVAAGASADSADADEQAPLVVEGVEIVDIEIKALVRERVLTLLRAKPQATVYELALAAYGNAGSGSTLADHKIQHKLGRLLRRMADEGLVELLARKTWRLAGPARA